VTICDTGRQSAKEQSVAVAGGSLRRLGADGPTCSGLILEDHRLAERFVQMFADQPTNGIRRSAGRIGINDAQRSLLRAAGLRQQTC
jgi:hypothetical protein